MNIKTFIDRPVLSTVISIVLVLGGLIGLTMLPIERYPNIAPPTINVFTTYTGANAETVQKSVIVPLEEAINGVENMTYMYSTASNNGTASIQVYFKQGTNPDMAAVNVQNAVARATRSLPTEVTDIGVTVKKRQANILMNIGLYTPNESYDRNFLVNYLKINLVPAISRIPGVGDIDVRGSDYSMRIWLKPDIMAQYKLIPSDITNALAEQNIEAATGSLGENSDNTFEYALRYKGRLEKSEEFENIVIRALPSGEVLKLKDVANIELGAQSYQYIGQINGHPGSSILIYQTPGSNATEVIKSIEKYLEEAREEFPIDVEMVVLTNSNDFLYASMKNVVRTLLEAIVLVILIVFIFLRSGKATVIPLISTIVSIVGTFFFLYLLGFSINILTMFALVLSIGVVVDDSIIVVEAVHARFDAGEKDRKKASVDAMHNVTSALITSTLVFMAVFIPVAMMGGTSGEFYRQFGITMAVSVGISAINALTLSPALCAMWLCPEGEKKNAFERGFNAVRNKYVSSVRYILTHRWIVVLFVALGAGFLVYNMNVTKTGLIPQEDMGVVRMEVQTPPGSSLRHTKSVLDKIDRDIVAGIEEKKAYENMAGFGQMIGAGSSHGSFTIRLKPWDQRPGKKHSAQAIIDRIKEYAPEMNDATIFTSAPAMIPGYGSSNGFELYIQDKRGGSVEQLYNVASEYLSALKAHPAIGSTNMSFKINFPQYMLDVDVAKCKRAGVSPKDVLSVINGYYGGRLSTKFNRFTKLYQVVVQADPRYRDDKHSLNNIFVRVGSDMAPVSQFVSMEKIYAPELLTRFNMFPCIRINGSAEEGYSSGDAINAIREVAQEYLPMGYGYDFGGIAREEASSGNNTIIIFVICFALIYLILCALYESYLLPFAVLLIIPIGLCGSFSLARIMGLENNIYLQTGLIMLIGLLAKTAILITEYAVQKRKEGLTITEAALEATKERFRPIIMTVLTMIVGLFPLLLASGVGANGNNTLGAGVVGGMILGTLGILFIVPCLFAIFQWLQEKMSGKKNSGVVAILAVLLVLSSCSVYKEYQRPEVKEGSEIFASSDTNSISDIGWRDFFTDPNLRNLIEIGLENNHDIKAARLRVLSAKSNLTAAKWAFAPGINFGPTAGINYSDPRYGGSAYSYSVPINASWEIDISGKTEVNRRKAKTALEQSEVYLKSVQTELVATIAECYFNLLKLDAQLKISESTAASWKENVRIMKAMKEAGMTNEASVSQTEANAWSIEASLRDLEYQISRQENNLASLLGVLPQKFERSGFKETVLCDKLSLGVPMELLSRRPDLQLAEYNLRQAFYDTALAHAAFYPSLVLTGSLGWDKALTSPAGFLASLAGSLVQPLFARGKLKAGLESSKARQEEAFSAYRQAILDAGTEVNNALALCHSASGKTEIRNNQIKSLESAVVSTRQLMRHSESTYLEVLTAQQSLLSARLLQVSDKYDSVIGVISLYKALGGGKD